MSNPWRIALVVVLVLLGIGGGTCALRTLMLVERQIEEQEVGAPESASGDDGSGSRD